MKQKSKLGTTTGSFYNWVMGNNSRLPEVGKGATVLLWTDRHAYEVIEVSDDKMECTIQRYDPERVDNQGMSESQVYKYEKLTEEKMHLVWRRDAWRQKATRVTFTKKFLESSEHPYALAKSLTEQQRNEIYQDDVRPQKVIPGITYLKTDYHKVNIIFGEKLEYYDFSF